jgi:acyl carrier protein
VKGGVVRDLRVHVAGWQLAQYIRRMPDSTRERLRGVVQKIAQQPVPDDPEESLFESGLLDSFALPDLVSALEQEFSIKVPDADLNPRKFDSISRMEAYLSSRA